MDVDVCENRNPEMRSPDQETRRKKSTSKRKKAAIVEEALNPEVREVRIGALRLELDGLVNYYKEISVQQKLDFREASDGNSRIACLLEESSLPLTKLVDEIYEKLKATGGSNGDLTVASVKSSVLLIAHRSFYGVSIPDADVLEDDTECCLWCWEAKEIKFLPKSMRGIIKIRKDFRKKIHERITTVHALIMALQKLETNPLCIDEVIKLSERLNKVMSEAEIRLSLGNLLHRIGSGMAEMDVKQEKLLVKELEKNKREVEREQKRIERERWKEKLQSEKELRQLQSKVEKEERRREKEESEMMKNKRKLQDETEREHLKREKEEAEVRRLQSLRKQASFMENFFKRRKNSSVSHDASLPKASSPDPSPTMTENVPEVFSSLMDRALSQEVETKADDIWKSHLTSWHQLGRAMQANNKQHWGIRRNPKKELVKEIKLSTTREITIDEEMNMEKTIDGWNETHASDRLCHVNVDISSSHGRRQNKTKQLLQFANSHRPAFYGVWQTKSQVVGPRHPFAKDPDLDYEIDSDEEWEEEEPGESLSDCDKDAEEESIEEGCSKGDDEDDNEDGFFVPDGYLSENEGVEVDRTETDSIAEEVRGSTSCEQGSQSAEFHALLRCQKYLNNLTEQLHDKNKPLIICNLMHEKTSSALAEDITGTMKVEQICLQALSICRFPGGPSIDISIEVDVQEDQNVCFLNGKGDVMPVVAPDILDLDLPQIVSTIQTYPHGINKVVEALQLKFPSVSKSQLKNKVREISEYIDNSWKVKKEILEKHGLSNKSPEICGQKTRSIHTFFSKRCLPPASNSNPLETSPVSSKELLLQSSDDKTTHNSFVSSSQSLKLPEQN